jgi:hypothetical protein
MHEPMSATALADPASAHRSCVTRSETVDGPSQRCAELIQSLSDSNSMVTLLQQRNSQLATELRQLRAQLAAAQEKIDRSVAVLTARS